MPNKRKVHTKARGLLQQGREFVAWDGEGITYAEGTAQHYVLFGNSVGDFVIDESGHSGPSVGLTTSACLDLLLRAKQKNPQAIHIGFAINYDVNMILNDLERSQLERIKENGIVRYRGYRLEWRPGKWFRVSKKGCSITLYDVFGFFQSSFVVACEKFLGKDDPELVGIKAGKSARASFVLDQLRTFILPYWQSELRLLVRLASSLRSDLLSANIVISSWHGPGAVANAVFRDQGIKHHKSTVIHKGVNHAARYAYAGGRFEQFRCGGYEGPVWEYDINSAYPYAISQLPSLSHGNWEYVTRFEPGTFGVWHVRYSDPQQSMLASQPFFCREKHGGVSYPPNVEGWYWTPEAELYPSAVIGGYVWRAVNDDRPFSFVQQMYDRRAEWKRDGNSAEKALKLALNSLYGKMAQRIGGQDGNIPTWHQLEWAGYVTSYTRAKLWGAMHLAGESIIATETDAIFTTRPIHADGDVVSLEIGDQLGQWSLTEFSNIIYLQSGLYYANISGDQYETVGVSKYRGLDKDGKTGQPKGLPARKVLAHLRNVGRLGGEIPPLIGTTTRFVGLGIGLHSKQSVWRSWETSSKEIHYGGSGKRTHIAASCIECQNGLPHHKNLHHTTISSVGGMSHPHSLPWVTDESPGADWQQWEDDERWN